MSFQNLNAKSGAAQNSFGPLGRRSFCAKVAAPLLYSRITTLDLTSALIEILAA